MINCDKTSDKNKNSEWKVIVIKQTKKEINHKQ